MKGPHSVKLPNKIYHVLYDYFMLFIMMMMVMCLGLNHIRLCHSTVSNLLVTYSISALTVSEQTCDVSCLGAFAEKGVLASYSPPSLNYYVHLKNSL